MKIVDNFRSGDEKDVIKTYVKQYLHDNKNNLYYQESTADV
jgi:hypothetical protein